MASIFRMPPLRSFAALLLAAALPLLTACGGTDGEPGGASAQGAQAEQPRRGGTAVIGWSAEPASVNELIVPGTAINTEVVRQLFLHLVKEQPDFEQHPPTFAPQLAESYEWSPDHRTLTFHLRKDVKWSDGVPVTAEDVRFTWQAQRDPDVAWENASMKESIADVEVVDPHTVRFHLSRAYSKAFLDVNEGGILPKHAWGKLPFSKWRESADWFRQNLVVSGPYTLDSWTPQQQFVLKRNESYYLPDRPYIDRVVIRNIPDQSSLMTQLFSGEIDFAPQISPAERERVKADSRLELIPYWFRLYVIVIWNTTDPLFSDPEVRRALTLGIDRQTIVDTLLGETGRVAVSPIVSNVWAHDRTLRPWPYNPAEARRILEARGWKDTDGDGVLDKDGKPFTFELDSNAGNQQRNDAAVMIQEQLKKVGVQVKPQVLEFNTLVERATTGQFESMVFGFTMDTGLDLSNQFHSSAERPEGNFGAYKNPEVDRLIERTLSVPEIEQAKDDFVRIQRILHQEQPFTFLWESQRLSAVNKRLRNVKPNVLFSLFNLEDWWIQPGG